MGKDMTPATAGRYQRVMRAPAGLRQAVSAGELDRLISTVDQWREVEIRLKAAQTAMVRDLRGRGASWDSIGWLFGVTGAAVWKRFRADVVKPEGAK